METVAYLQLAQGREDFEQSELNAEFKNLKLPVKTISVVGIASTALTGGLLSVSPASANYSPCCQQVVYQSIYESSGCQSQCYYPQHYSYDNYSGYYPEQYSSSNYHDSGYYESSYDESSYSDCNCHSEQSYEESYEGVAYYPSEPNLSKVGAEGEFVAALQEALIAQGFDPGAVDGVYGHRTAEAVAQYQAIFGLQVDGVAGPETLGSLGLV